MSKYTLITGASDGLGAQFAKLAARENRNMILTARNVDKMEAVAAPLRDEGLEVIVIPADLSDLKGATKMWKEATKQKREIDVFVNNAGLGYSGRFDVAEAWQRELDSIQVNMVSFTYLLKQAITHMQAHGGGRILNVASTAGFMPGPNMAVYHATKAYALSLSEAVAEELRDTNVSVTALAPGATATNFQAEADMHDIRLMKFGKPMDAFHVAEEGWLEARIAKRVVVPGWINKVFAFLPRLFPRSMLLRVTSVIMGRAKS
jgi:short-subunit dehydrogenase